MSCNHFRPYQATFVQELHGDDTYRQEQFFELFEERHTHQKNFEADFFEQWSKLPIEWKHE